MKIVCLIKPSPPLIYFVNRINDNHPIEMVIIEKQQKTVSSLLSKIKTNGIRRSLKVIKDKTLKKNRYITDYSKFFGDKWTQLHGNIPQMKVESINSRRVLDYMEKTQPDLILDHGTSIVRNDILEASKLALNLHWGLSPYYRGTHCTEWALINWDPYNIGVTIHKLTKNIDGGDILAQKRAVVTPDDSVHSINMQLTHFGTELTIKAITKMKQGNKLTFAKQNTNVGYLTYLRQWNYWLDKQIEHIEQNKLVELMLRNPSRTKKLPLVHFQEK